MQQRWEGGVGGPQKFHYAAEMHNSSSSVCSGFKNIFIRLFSASYIFIQLRPKKALFFQQVHPKKVWQYECERGDVEFRGWMRGTCMSSGGFIWLENHARSLPVTGLDTSTVFCLCFCRATRLLCHYPWSLFACNNFAETELCGDPAVSVPAAFREQREQIQFLSYALIHLTTLSAATTSRVLGKWRPGVNDTKHAANPLAWQSDEWTPPHGLLLYLSIQFLDKLFPLSGQNKHRSWFQPGHAVQSVFTPSRKVKEINFGRQAPCSLDGLICLYVSKLSDGND